MQFSSQEEYNKEAKRQERLKHNQEINRIVAAHIEGDDCECGAKDSLKQVKSGTYIMQCTSCHTRYKLEK